MYDLIIKNARLMLPENVYKGSIAIENGKIVKIARNFQNNSADKILDAKENFLLPGVIDVHVHFRDFRQKNKEDWKTGSQAAAAGGVTTVLDMPNNDPPITTLKRLQEKRKLAEKNSIVDFGFHFGASLNNEKEIRKIKNVASVKFYLGSTTGNLLMDNDAKVAEYFEILAKKKIPATIHGEDEQMVQYYTKLVRKRKDILAYSDARPNICAAESVNKVLYFSKFSKNPVHFCHVSTCEEVDMLRKHHFKWISAEASPHHLLLSRKDFKKLGTFGKMNPPLRREKDRQELWRAIADNTIKIIATDHAPHTKEEKERGDIWAAPGGVPGVETSLPLMLNEVSVGRLFLLKLIKLMSENPATIFGIKNKGRIKEGYDADLVLVDMKKKKKIQNSELFTKCKWSPFDGKPVKGLPIKTFVRGNLVFDEGIAIKNRGNEVKFSHY